MFHRYSNGLLISPLDQLKPSILTLKESQNNGDVMPHNSQSIRQEYVCPLLEEKEGDIQFILGNITGGWESWLQVELGMKISKVYGEGFSREKAYYKGSGVNYDLCVKGDRGTPIYFEIKTQNYVLDSSTARRLQSDINKIYRLSSEFKKKYVVIAFAVSNLSNPEEVRDFEVLMQEEAVAAYDITGKELGRNIKDNQLTIFWYSND